MKSFLTLCFLAITAAAMGNPVWPYATEVVGSIPNSNYGFNYAVNDPHTGDNKAQWEVRHGDVVKGAYSLVEPDGNVRLVEYTADPIHGFNAVVKRTGPTIHSVTPVGHAISHNVMHQMHPALPYLPMHGLGPLVQLTGITRNKHGHVTRRWESGPISLDGQVIKIRTH